MCLACYEEYGSPKIDNPTVRAAAEAIGKVYDFADTGGNLHIAIDDWNLDDDDLDFCGESIAKNDVHEAPPDQLAAEGYCLGLLKAMSEDERASALAIHDGFWTPGGET